MSYREKWQELAHELFADYCKPCGDYKHTSEMRACLCSDVSDIIDSEFNSQNFTGSEYNNHMNMLMDAMDKERSKDMYGKKQRLTSQAARRKVTKKPVRKTTKKKRGGKK